MNTEAISRPDLECVFQNVHAALENPLLTANTEPHRRSLPERLQAALSGSTCAEAVKERLRAEFMGTGPIGPLLSRSGLTEILINGRDQIWYEQDGQLHQLNDGFLSPFTYRSFLARLCQEAEINVDLERPFGDGVWRGFRVHLVLPPLAKGDAHLSLRAQSHRSWSLQRLGAAGWANPEVLSKLASLVTDKKNLLIAGPTGSGKTSVLNACLQLVGPNERIVSIEDTDEIQLPNSASAKLLTRSRATATLPIYNQADLVVESLRMRPDRLVMGEVRGPEAKDLLMAFATGHRGGLTTLHSESARQALLRLEMLVQLGAPQWNHLAIRQLIYLSVEYILIVMVHGGRRQFKSLHKISGLEENGFLLDLVLSSS